MIPTGQALMRMVMAQIISRPSNQSVSILVRSTLRRIAPAAETVRPIAIVAKPPAAPMSALPAAIRARPVEHPPIAESSTEEAAGQREEDSGEREQPDEPSEIDVRDVEPLDEERRDGAHGLELEAHGRASDRQDSQRGPATAVCRRAGHGAS